MGIRSIGIVAKLKQRFQALGPQANPLQDYLDLLPEEFSKDSEQYALIRDVLATLQEIKDDDQRKLLVLISGAPGTGKSIVAQLILVIWSHMQSPGHSPKYEDYGTILLQGQTWDRKEKELLQDNPELTKCLGKWSGQPVLKGGERKWHRDVVIIDEAHLAPPLRTDSLSYAMLYGLNNKDLEERRRIVHELASGNTGQEVSTTASIPELLLERAASESKKCLIVVRDSTQVHQPLSMTDHEFADSISAILKSDCAWDADARNVKCTAVNDSDWLFLNRVLATQHRTSHAWFRFIKELMQPGTIDLGKLHREFKEFLRDDGDECTVFADKSRNFSAVVMDDAAAFVESVDEMAVSMERSEGRQFRVLATHSWEKETVIDLDGNGTSLMAWAPYAWPLNDASNPDQIVQDKTKKRDLANWPRKSNYDYRSDGVGYIMSCQNQDFSAVGAIIGPNLRWVWDSPDTGHWKAEINDWRPYHTVQPKVQKYLAQEDRHEEVLERMFAEVLVLLTRPTDHCLVYFSDPQARDAMRRIGFTRIGSSM